MLKNNGAAEGTAALQGAIVIDGQNLDPTDFNGDIETKVSLGESCQPYIGIGWGRGAGDDGDFRFRWMSVSRYSIPVLISMQW
jgi:hypothetical protein